jgi:hypothetical protein
MATKLTNTGVEYPNGTTQTVANNNANCSNCSSYANLTSKPTIPANCANCNTSNCANCDNGTTESLGDFSGSEYAQVTKNACCNCSMPRGVQWRLNKSGTSVRLYVSEWNCNCNC